MGPNALPKCLAEMIGTFALIFVGAGAIMLNSLSPGTHSLLAIALAHGLTIAVMVSATGHISGGQLNPAVTMGALVGRKISLPLGLAYMLAQLLGAVLAAFLLMQFFHPDIVEKAKLGTPMPNPQLFSAKAAFGLEAILTFFLVFVVFGTGIDPKGPKIGGLAIGLTVTLDILIGGPLSGAAMNPARTFGPALAGGFWTHHWVYWAGPMLGGAAAGLLYDRVISKGASAS